MNEIVLLICVALASLALGCFFGGVAGVVVGCAISAGREIDTRSRRDLPHNVEVFGPGQRPNFKNRPATSATRPPRPQPSQSQIVRKAEE